MLHVSYFMKKTISLHPKLAGSIDAILNIAILLALTRVGAWWVLGLWFLGRIILWLLLIRLVYYPKEINKAGHFFSLLLFFLGVSLLFIFVEWRWSWYLLVFVFLFLPWMSFWILPAEAKQLPFVFKPYRRWRLIMNTLSVAGIWGGISAVLSLDIFKLGSWAWIFIGSIISTILAVWWWLEYDTEKNKKLLIWSLIWFLLMLELSWVVFLLPLGYLVNGLVMAWFWYGLWLLVRFHLSKEGIDWKKQIPFYSASFFLLILFLSLFARWK